MIWCPSLYYVFKVHVDDKKEDTQVRIQVF